MYSAYADANKNLNLKQLKYVNISNRDKKQTKACHSGIKLDFYRFKGI
jgi:hypothetical protein